MPESETLPYAEALHKQVAERAYALWESEGRPHGRDLDHWRQAECEIMASGTTEGAPSSTASAASRKKESQGFGRVSPAS